MALPKYVTDLIKVYRSAQESLVQTISEKEARGNLVNYENSLLNNIEFILSNADRYALEWSNDVIPGQYRNGVNEAVSRLGKYNIEVPGYNAFARVHNKAVGILVRNTIEDLTDASSFVGRQIRDNVRQAGLDAITQKLSTGATVRQTKLNLQRSLVSKGINGIRDKRGRMISLDAYASTVARSTTREATNTATMNHLQSLGYDLVKMSSHATSCEICAVLQGRVYSLTGNTKGYPVLTSAYGSHANIHPNCRHVIFPYVAELADDREGDRVFSNRPFDIDPRSKAEMDRYNKVQKEKSILRNDRNQYQRYRLALGNDAPKSFAGFRSMKKADSERWSMIQLDYHRRNRLANNPNLLLPNVSSATAADTKFTKYLFNPESKDGWPKGVAFNKRLGYNSNNWKQMQEEILLRADSYPAKLKLTDQYGSRYEQQMIMYGQTTRPTNVLVGWNVTDNDTIMTTAYIKEVKSGGEN